MNASSLNQSLKSGRVNIWDKSLFLHVNDQQKTFSRNSCDTQFDYQAFKKFSKRNMIFYYPRCKNILEGCNKGVIPYVFPDGRMQQRMVDYVCIYGFHFKWKALYLWQLTKGMKITSDIIKASE